MSDRDLLARLVAFDSVSTKPSAPLADFLADYLQAAGCEVTPYPYDDGRKVNLIARKGPDVEGGLLLSGHLDVVPADEDGWTCDPFQLTERNNRYIGRGTADMKGFVTLAANLLARTSAEALGAPLVLLLSSDEEIGTIGAQNFVDKWDRSFILPGEAIVGEPTGLNVVRMHKGHLFIRLTITGRSAHSGYPHLGTSAIEPVAELIALLRHIRKGFEAERSAESAYFDSCPHPVLNIGTIAGGSAINVVPDRCVVDIGVRLMPRQSSGKFVEEFESKLARMANLPSDRVHGEVINNSPPMFCPPEAPIYLQLCELLDQSETYAEGYASDAGPLQKLGITSVLWGPGHIQDAHQPNEYLEVQEFERAGRLLERFVGNRCLAASG